MADIHTSLETLLAEIGNRFPLAFLFFPEDSAPSMPYVLWRCEGERSYPGGYRTQQCEFTLRTAKKDLAAEHTLEAIFGYGFAKSEGENENEGVYEVSYALDI